MSCQLNLIEDSTQIYINFNITLSLKSNKHCIQIDVNFQQKSLLSL